MQTRKLENRILRLFSKTFEHSLKAPTSVVMKRCKTSSEIIQLFLMTFPKHRNHENNKVKQIKTFTKGLHLFMSIQH